MLHPSDNFGDTLQFGVRVHFEVAVWPDLINVIHAVKSTSLLTQLVNGGKAAGWHWSREEPVLYMKNLDAGTSYNSTMIYKRVDKDKPG